ncbi:PaaI family thioesterase [Profundibacter sp.]
MSTIQDQERYAKIAKLWSKRSKGLIAEMDIQVEKADPDSVLIRMPHNPDFCLDEEGTLLHGGVLTALLDSAFGLAIFLNVPDMQTMATLDLRVDYLRAAQSRADVMVSANCYRTTRHIAFSSGKIWFDADNKEEVAHGAAAFALTRGKGDLLEMMKEADTK